MSGREGQTYAGESWFVRYANFVKLPHTVFALPFALVGLVFASYTQTVQPIQVVWIVLAFTAARFVAMGFNRIVDRRIDALNPRTRLRELPAGKMRVAEAWIAIVVAAVVFVGAAYALNPLCFALSPLALAWVCFYSYTKRFTQFAHLVLGLSLAIAPVGGYLAMTGQWSEPWWMLCALALAVASWVAGFDILYAMQDIEFDRSNRLHSIPAKLGAPGALMVARGLHVVTVVSLILVGVATGGGVLYGLGVTVAAALLLYEHSLVKPSDLSKLDAAFFTMNGVISIIYFGFVLTERLVS